MKQTKQLLTLAIVGTMISFTACKKKGCIDADATNYSGEAKKDDGSCVYGPTITLNGSESMEVALGGEFLDPGAIAKNKDGSSETVAVDLGGLNVNQAGSYTLTYTAENENGSVSITRLVHVVFNQSSWIADWDVSNDCPTAFPVKSTASIEGGLTDSDVNIVGMFTLVGGTAEATISGETISIASQTVGVTGGDITYSGSGTMNASGTEITIEYDYVSTVPLIGGQGTCIATYTKQ